MIYYEWNNELKDLLDQFLFVLIEMMIKVSLNACYGTIYEFGFPWIRYYSF